MGAFVRGGGTYLFAVTLLFLAQTYHEAIPQLSMVSKLVGNYLGDYKSLPNLLIACPIFLFFERLDIGARRWINTLARSAFAVYLVHQGPGIIHPLWFDFYQCETWLASDAAIPYVFFVIFSVYLGISAIDTIRIRWIEPAFVRSRVFHWMEERIDRFYQP